MTVKRSTVSFDPKNWQRLATKKNKSKVVNEALRMFFIIEAMNAQKECEYSDKELEVLQKEWDHYKNTGESYQYDDVFSRGI